MKKISKILCIVLCFMLILTITSCNIIVSNGNTGNNNTENKDDNQTSDVIKQDDDDDTKYILSDIEVPTYETVTTDNVGVYVAAKVMPATVVITCNITFSYKQQYYSFYGGSRAQTYTNTATSCATGMIINENGYIITNAHVVCIEGSSSYPSFEYKEREIYVNYADSEKQFKCEIVTYDEDVDLCILKMDISNIENIKYVTYLNLTSPEDEAYQTDSAVKLLYGECAVAIGNANGYGISVTKGVVSAPVRKFDGKTFAIQTDTAINSGNSGGPLCDAYGNVIGVNSFKIVTSTSEGLGYAIPTYEVLKFIDSYNKTTTTKVLYHTTNTRTTE